MFETILHPTDFSAGANQALKQAAVFARKFGAKLHLFHKVVYPEPHVPPDLLEHVEDFRRFDALLREYTEAAEEDARERLSALAIDLRRGGATVSFEVERSPQPTCRWGWGPNDLFRRSLSPAEAIIREAERVAAELIVMGTHGRTGAARVLMGSVAERVLRSAPAHVLTLREDSALADAFGRILVPVDFSDTAERALAVARSLAKRTGGALHLLHVVERAHAPFQPSRFKSRLEAEPLLEKKYLDALKAMLGDSPGEVAVVEGNVAAEILTIRERSGAELVVMGTRGLGGLEHLLRGSVAEKITRFCEVPVLTVR